MPNKQFSKPSSTLAHWWISLKSAAPLLRHAVRLFGAWVAKARAAGADTLTFRMTAVGASAHAALAVGRGRDRSCSLLVTLLRGCLCTRQAHGCAITRCQGGSRQQRRDNDAQDKTHDD